MASVAASAAAIVALTGCVTEEEPEPSGSASSAEPSASGTFDEAAVLAEVQSVYEAYAAALPNFYSSERPDYTALSEWASQEVATNEAAAAADLQANGLRLEGAPSVVRMIIAPDSEPSTTSVAVGLCSDISGTRFVNSDGEDVTPSDRPNPAALALQFERPSTERAWIISSMGPWTQEASPCD